jgi:uncharacterized Zn finger protein
MPYLNCPTCGLVLAVIKPGRELVEHCPRCLARRRRLVDMYVSARPRGRRREDSAAAGQPRPAKRGRSGKTAP